MATNRKPRASDDEEPVHLISGRAETSQGKSGYPKATLWVPDPTIRSGWNEWNIYHEEPPRRSPGFKA